MTINDNGFFGNLRARAQIFRAGGHRLGEGLIRDEDERQNH